ncbi:tellurite resistance protein [Rhodovulum imhoffii]|uniref:Tellurite resistance protein n=1 Tax=Rhodovulum imhoffii TaxID=365340 RepID=A0A2T5BV96_9RHOB|nr:tellurium resistance protein [Rhodovulum imhoffii]MBK5934246.1 hypothetical protein [Rhodovulum imhoffii]PTN03507.1 tellurite resistance protein [Rhodovulum imhoffii]
MFTPRPRFGEQTPPAIFPPVLGALGLGLAWGRAADVSLVPAAIGQILLGAMTLVLAFCLFAYGLKVFRRPGTVVEDLRVLPGRAGVAAAILSLYLSSMVLAEIMPVLAQVVFWGGIGLHLVLVGILVWVFLSGPQERRRVSPVWHLLFAGFIVAGLAAVPLGYENLATWIFHITTVCALGIWGSSAIQLVRESVPAPLRPLLAIHLAPACLLGLVAAALGFHDYAVGFTVLAGAILGVLLVRLPWMLESGFSPLWGAFTFPLAAFANLMLVWAGSAGFFRNVAAVILVAASLSIPPILVGILRAWAKGELGPRTNAARV